MAKGSNQKLKLFYLLDLLEKKTDREHGVTMSEIIEHLESNGIDAERKSIYSDINSLNEFRYDIKKRKVGNKTIYYLDSRLFKLQELKLLAASVQASHIISESRTKDIVKKLQRLTNETNGPALLRTIAFANDVKIKSDGLFNTLDVLNEAIEKRKMVSLDSCHYNTNKELEVKSSYKLPALKLVWSNDKYYFLAYDESTKDHIRMFRVDRIKNVKILDDEWNKLKVRDLDFSKYIKEQVNMGIGESKAIKIELDKSLIDQAIDMFGTGVTILNSSDPNKVVIVINVMAGSTFYSWLMNYEGKIKIVGPQSVVSEFEDFVKKNLSAYNLEIK